MPAGKGLSGVTTSVGNWVKTAAKDTKDWTVDFTNEWILDDSQTRLGEKSDATPKKSHSPVDNTVKYSSASTTAYQVKDLPAALSVDSTFTNSSSGNPKSTGEDGQLPYSLFNRYALYNFRGFYGGYSPSLADRYTDAENKSGVLRGEDKVERDEGASQLRGLDLNDVNERKVIKYYAENYPRIAYGPTDFLYNKYFQEIPVNHLITLRRFAMPCEDNIFEKDGNYLATCIATTYLGEKANNKLDDILKFTNVGISWEDKEAQLQEISAGSSTSGPGAFDNKTKGKPSLISGLGATLAGKSAASIYKAEHFGGGSDPMHKYGEFVLGPVNVIDHTYIRQRGIKFTNDIDLTFEYELKSWFKVNPKIAMLDLMSNMLVMTTNNGNFWGGGWRYNGGQSQSLITDLYGDRSKLRNGDFIGYAQSVVTDVIHGNNKGVKGITGLFGDGSGAFSFESVLGGLKDLLQNILTQKIGSIMDSFSGGQQNAGADVPKALLSAEPTGYWHLTVGNPLNPIAIMGNMICMDNELVLGGGLGYDDFPMEFKATVKLKHGKPRDRSDIENMFNMGHGRIYAAPHDDDDVLNVAGKEIQEYGVYPTGPGMHTGITNVAKKLDMGKEHVANIVAMNILD